MSGGFRALVTFIFEYFLVTGTGDPGGGLMTDNPAPLFAISPVGRLETVARIRGSDFSLLKR